MMSESMRLTRKAAALIERADAVARSMGSERVGTGHLLEAMALHRSYGDALDYIIAYLRLAPSARPVAASAGKPLPFTPDMEAVMAFAGEEARAMGYCDELDNEHLVLGITRVEGCSAATALVEKGRPLRAVRETVFHVLETLDILPHNWVERHAGSEDP